MGDFILGSVGVVGDVTGVKGDKEVSYRSGNVNLTPANIGALDVANVYNGLDKTAAGYSLDARQGKALNDQINATQSDIAIIIEGNQTTHTDGVAVGEYVIVRNSTISGITDGLYKAVQAIPANTAIDKTYLTACSNGIANSLSEQIGNILSSTKLFDSMLSTTSNTYQLSESASNFMFVALCVKWYDHTVDNVAVFPSNLWTSDQIFDLHRCNRNSDPYLHITNRDSNSFVASVTDIGVFVEIHGIIKK